MADDLAPTLPQPTAQRERTKLAPEEIVQILEGYRIEAEHARAASPDGRDEIWANNIRLYWNQFDYSKKAAWQSKEAMPEAPMFVDRWAASMRDALATPEHWYSIIDQSDKEGDLAKQIEKFLDVQLVRCARNASGQPMDFHAVFEELMKMAAMMAATASCTWKVDAEGHGYAAVEPVDPREVWYDPTGRGLYRVRRMVIDRWRLREMAKMEAGGRRIFREDQMALLEEHLAEEDLQQQKDIAGHGKDSRTHRKPITIDEYLCTLIDPQGDKVADNVLCVVANGRFLIRGPEPNPFWHGKDWLVYAPAVPVPLSVYGRTYMESWASVARTFVELTNIIVDAVYVSSIKAFTVIEDMMEDPTELEEGVFPSKVFRLQGGSDATKFLTAVDLGELPTSSVSVWQALKQELREGAAFNEIALGQMADRSSITATEVQETQSSSMALLRSISRTIEARFLEPMLELVWKTALQHLDPEDDELRQVMGDEWFNMFLERAGELAERRITFQVRGISSLIARGQKLRALTQALSILGSNEILAQPLMQKVSPEALVDEIFMLAGVDTRRLEATPRQQMIGDITAPMVAPNGGSPPAPDGMSEPGGF